MRSQNRRFWGQQLGVVCDSVRFRRCIDCHMANLRVRIVDNNAHTLSHDIYPYYYSVLKYERNSIFSIYIRIQSRNLITAFSRIVAKLDWQCILGLKSTQNG